MPLSLTGTLGLLFHLSCALVCSQWDYKTRIQNQNELLAKLRAMLNNMLQQKHRFKDACIDTEAALKVTGYCCYRCPWDPFWKIIL